VTATRDDNEKSFSLTKPAPVGSQNLGLERPPLSWQEQAYDRLKVLYGVSKLLSSAYNVERAFPQILNLCASTFPFVTGILIEKRNVKTNVCMWHADNVSQSQIDQAAENAKRSFSFLTGASKLDASVLSRRKTPSDLLSRVIADEQSQSTNLQNYISLPLMVDDLPAFGILQLGGSGPLTEQDLEFTDALASLVAVAVDRNFKTERDRALRLNEALESSSKLSDVENTVLDLEEEQDIRDSFVSMLTHDLKVPLTTAKINAQQILKPEQTRESIQPLAESIVLYISRAEQMVSDLFDANCLRNGEILSLKLEDVDLGVLLQATLDSLALIYGDRFVVSCPDKIEGHWDRRYVRTIIENLAIHAVRFGDPQNKISVMSRKSDETVFLDVHNKGIPIDPLEQQTLLQQTRRIQRARGAKKVNLGVGLTVVRGVVEAHGGAIQMRSELELGTVFTVTLPVDSRTMKSPGQKHDKF
jgi:signal transduction histidine kinase